MIHVIIPNYNNEDCIERCLDSVAQQEDVDFTVQVIDDDSTDNSIELIIDWCEQRPNWNWVCNHTNQKCPRNLWDAVLRSGARRQDVFFILDGDDFLPHPRVLHRIAEVYEDPEVWLTYGSYEGFPPDDRLPPVKDYPDSVRRRRQFRSYGQSSFNHPLTFRAHLWWQLSFQDFADDDGVWFVNHYDQAIMFPLMEMASQGHYRVLTEVLYTYNSGNPLSEVYTNEDNRVQTIWTRAPKPIYEPNAPISDPYIPPIQVPYHVLTDCNFTELDELCARREELFVDSSVLSEGAVAWVRDSAGMRGYESRLERGVVKLWPIPEQSDWEGWEDWT